MYEPLISVIIPVYNAEDRLKDSIESVLNQNYKQIELILIDDGSSDNSLNMCKKYTTLDSRVKVYHQKNAGVSTARNHGIDVSTGEYITFVDADDTIKKNTYSLAVSNLINMDLDMIIYGMSFDYYKDYEFIKNKNLNIDNFIIRSLSKLRDNFFKLYENNYLSSVCNKIIKASIIKDNHLHFKTDIFILEDFKFVLELLEYTEHIGVMRDVLYHYYKDVDESSLTKRPDIDYLYNFKKIDHQLRKTSKDIGLTTSEDKGRIYSMIFRYYLIGVEKIFSTDATLKEKYEELNRYIKDESFIDATTKAICNGRRLKLVHWLVKKNKINTLYMLFNLNSLTKTIRRYLLS